LSIGKVGEIVYILVMNLKNKRKLAARIVFIAGILFMVLGITFLLGSLENTSIFSVFVAFFLLVAGGSCAMFAIKLNKRPIYLFFASLLMMVGIFIFLSALGIVTLPISRAWPMLSIFSGLALLPIGWRSYGKIHPRYLVSSCAFVVLGVILMIFSLRIIPFSFMSFVHTWWPLLFLLGGFTLVLTSISTRGEKKD
jgi:uncharacterized membrane protein HdeD (DUF308 family)